MKELTSERPPSAGPIGYVASKGFPDQSFVPRSSQQRVGTKLPPIGAVCLTKTARRVTLQEKE
jgi:hypothetical protein